MDALAVLLVTGLALALREGWPQVTVMTGGVRGIVGGCDLRLAGAWL